jgi:hypothetical protein
VDAFQLSELVAAVDAHHFIVNCCFPIVSIHLYINI